MNFGWDEGKARQNFREHGVFFETAVLAFEDPGAVFIADRIIETEERWHLIGMIPSGGILLVVHTVRERRQGENVIRIVSARRATPRERILWQRLSKYGNPAAP